MEGKEWIEREVDRTLDCFDDDEGIGASPFFYTRLEERMRGSAAEGPAPAFLRAPTAWLRPAFLLAVLAVNVATTAVVIINTDTATETRRETLRDVADELLMDTSETSLLTLGE